MFYTAEWDPVTQTLTTSGVSAERTMAPNKSVIFWCYLPAGQLLDGLRARRGTLDDDFGVYSPPDRRATPVHCVHVSLHTHTLDCPKKTW